MSASGDPVPALSPGNGDADAYADGDDRRWISQQVEALAASWERGVPISVDELLAARPDLDSEAAIRLIYEDVSLRRDAGLEVVTIEIVERYPQWREELEILLGCDRMLRPQTPRVVFPEPGTALGPYQLLAELGRGSSGRTYLASEPALADRPVVLKLIPMDQEEHLRLARLQHTHIVPLFSEQTFAEAGLRALCMPYLGGATLGQILDAIRDIPHHERRARHLLQGLAAASTHPIDVSPPADSGPCRRYLEEAPYADALCWIAACLADALQYAHDRGLFHMDVNPANVLIAADGQPMLLDFHLARAPIAAGEWAVGRLGGTPGWMAPEQEAAFAAAREGHAVPVAVDGRADLYALGLLLREALGGGSPAATADAGVRPGPPPPGGRAGLAEILARCLSVDPADRYPDAASLAEDLRRYLNHLPLQGSSPPASITAVPSSLPGRHDRRHSPTRPRLRLRAIAGLVAVAALAAAFHAHRVSQIRGDMEDGQRHRIAGNPADALRCLRRGLDRAAGLPAIERLRGRLTGEMMAALRAEHAAELHRLADLIRFRSALTPPTGVEGARLAAHCRALWDARQELLPIASASAHSLSDDATAESIRTDLLDLATLWSDLNVQLAPPADAGRAGTASLEVLAQAEAAFGPSPALRRDRQRIARACGLDPPTTPSPADTRPAATAREHDELGRSYLRSGDLELAAVEFEQVLAERPQDFWPRFYDGLGAYRRSRYEDARAAFQTCIALRPRSAECYYYRALANEALGRSEDARSDDSRALEIDPNLIPALLHRASLSYHARRFADSIHDYQRALAQASDDDARAQIHYNLALAFLAAGDRTAALASSQHALDLGCRAAGPLCEQLRQQQAKL